MSSSSRRNFLAATVAAAVTPRVARAQAAETLRMSAVSTDDMTPIYWALKTGLYQKAGIDLEIVAVSSGSASTAAVISGAYEMGKASPVAAMLAHLRGLPVTIVANGSIFQTRDRWSAAVAPLDSPIKSAADCNGKIACSAGLNDIHQLSMMNWVDKNGGDATTMKWVEVPGSATAPALIEHRIDVSMLDEPLLSAALATGKLHQIGNPYATISDRWLTSAYLVQPDYAAKHGGLLRRFARVTYQAAAYTNAHEAETIPMMSDASKIPLPVFSKMARIEGATSGDPRLLTPLIEVTARYKLIPKTFPAAELYWGG